MKEFPSVIGTKMNMKNPRISRVNPQSLRTTIFSQKLINNSDYLIDIIILSIPIIMHFRFKKKKNSELS